MSPFLFVSVPFPTEKPFICRWRSVPFLFVFHFTRGSLHTSADFILPVAPMQLRMSLRKAINQHRRDQGKHRRGAHGHRKRLAWRPVRVGRKRLGLAAHARAFAVECNRKSVSENRAVYTKSAGYKYALVDWVG